MSEEFNPYASPSVPDSGSRPLGTEDYLSGARRAKWAVGCLFATMVVSISQFIGSGYWIYAFSHAPQTRLELIELQRSFDSYTLLESALCAPFAIAAIIAFCMWIHRAHWNLVPLGARGLRYSPGWAVGSFFVPILNFFRPYQITQEIFRGSDPETIGQHVYQSSKVSGSSLILWWWITFNVPFFCPASVETGVFRRGR